MTVHPHLWSLYFSFSVYVVLTHHVYLSIGSNLGNRRENLSRAVLSLQEQVGSVVACSSFITTEPWGFESEHIFLNAAVHIVTEFSPCQLLLATQRIERELGRVAKSTNGKYHDRVIDIDILSYDDLTLNESILYEDRELTLVLPHPLMRKRDFVMVPLRQIDFDL